MRNFKFAKRILTETEDPIVIAEYKMLVHVLKSKASSIPAIAIKTKGATEAYISHIRLVMATHLVYILLNFLGVILLFFDFTVVAPC